ncbi:MAG: hypothetical protein AAGL66_01970 [Pseudomonadota bacterium]
MAVIRALFQQIALATSMLCGRGAALRASNRVALQCYTLHHVIYFQTLVRALANRSDIEFELLFLPHPHIASSEKLAIARFARESLGLQTRSVVTLGSRYWTRFDVILYPDTFARLMPRSRANVLLYHGIGTPRRYTRRAIYRRSAAAFDLVLSASELDTLLLEAQRPARAKMRVVTTGTVLFDRIPVREPRRLDYLRGLGFVPTDAPTVLVAPHWSRLLHADKGLIEQWRQALAKLAELDAHVILKLHAHSYHPIANRGRDWRSTTTNWVNARVRLDPTIDDAVALSHADVLVTDVSSRALVAASLGTPVVRFDDSTLSGHVSRPYPLEQAWSETLEEASFVATNLPELLACVRTALTGGSPPSAKSALARAGIVNDKAVTSRIVDTLASLMVR